MADNRYDLSVTKANMEYAAEVAKDKRLTGDRYKLSTVDPAYGPAKNSSHARYDTPRTPLEFVPQHNHFAQYYALANNIQRFLFLFEGNNTSMH